MSGGELSRRFHADVVAPLLAEAMPGLGYAAGRLGSGSDVLGFDDAMSREHDWGCRLTLLVDEPHRDAVPQITGLLERGLPEAYRGYPVRCPRGPGIVEPCRACMPHDQGTPRSAP